MNSFYKHILYSEPSVFYALKNKKVTILGHTGFFGSWLFNTIKYANEHADLKIVLNGFSSESINLADPNALSKINDEIFRILENSDIILNFAGKADENRPEVLIGLALNAMRLYKMFPASLYVYASSASVSCFNGGGGMIDNFPTEYTMSKKLCEKFLTNENNKNFANTPVLILRPSTTIGPGMPLDKHFFASILMSTLLNKTHDVPTMMTPMKVSPYHRRSFAHIRDVTRQILILSVEALNSKVHSKIFDVGSKNDISLIEACECVGVPYEVTYQQFVSNSNAVVMKSNHETLLKDGDINQQIKDSVCVYLDSREALQQTANYLIINRINV